MSGTRVIEEDEDVSITEHPYFASAGATSFENARLNFDAKSDQALANLEREQREAQRRSEEEQEEDEDVSITEHPYFASAGATSFENARLNFDAKSDQALANLEREQREAQRRSEEEQAAFHAMEIDGIIAHGMSALRIGQGANEGQNLARIEEDDIDRLEIQLEEQRQLREKTTKVALERYFERETSAQAGDARAPTLPSQEEKFESGEVSIGASDVATVIDILDSSESDSEDEKLMPHPIGTEMPSSVDEWVHYTGRRAQDKLALRVAVIKERLSKQRRVCEAWREANPLAERAQGGVVSVNLMPEFEEEEEELYDMAMSNEGPDRVLFERNNAPVSRSTMHALAPRQWLNDEVINQYLALLRERSLELTSESESDHHSSLRIKSYFHLSLFYSKLMEGGKYDYARVRRWTTRGKRKCDLFAMDRVFFPRNIGNSHWALGWADMNECRFEYLDSMGSNPRSFVSDCLRYLADEHKDKKKSSLDTSQWKVVNHGRSVPQQNNCDDCGVFLSTFCNYISLAQPLEFDCSDMLYFRKRMAVDLMAGRSTFEPLQ